MWKISLFFSPLFLWLSKCPHLACCLHLPQDLQQEILTILMLPSPLSVFFKSSQLLTFYGFTYCSLYFIWSDKQWNVKRRNHLGVNSQKPPKNFDHEDENSGRFACHAQVICMSGRKYMIPCQNSSCEYHFTPKRFPLSTCIHTDK